MLRPSHPLLRLTTGAAALCATAMPAFAQIQPPASEMNAPAPAADSAEEAPITLSDGYVLGPGDVIEVAVVGQQDYRARVQVQSDGTIQLPFIKTVQAGNKSVVELRNLIQQRLKSGGFYADPAVSVSVVNYASRYVVVLGEVGTPGIVPVDRAYRVSEILARVGGIRAPGATVITLTRADGQTQQLSLMDVATGGRESDPIVNPGDKVYVAPAKTFYIYGQVQAPGTYPIDRDMTLRKALARGGGLTPLGSENRVKVIRDGKEIEDFDPSSPILDGDVVVVGERFF